MLNERVFDLMADVQSKLTGLPTGDFDDVSDGSWAGDEGSVHGLCVFMDSHNRSGFGNKDHVQGDACVFHPESHLLRVWKREQHGLMGCHLCAEHHPDGPSFGRVLDFCVEDDGLCGGDDVQAVLETIHIRCGCA